MDDDDDTPPAPPRPSQIPSWVTLGFVLGALFVLALPRRGQVAPSAAPAPGAAPVAAPAPAKPAAPPEAPRIATIEAVFEDWGRYAVWSNDLTEVALWNAGTKDYTDYFEVARVGDGLYFRTLTSLSRPILMHGVPDGSPLQYTETAKQRREWLNDVQRENTKAFAEGIQKTFGPPAEEPQKK
jgi:hypothetical protein